MRLQHQSYIDQAAHVQRSESEPDWHTKDEAYQRKCLRGIRLEMVEWVPTFGNDRSRENFEVLLGVAHVDIQRDYQIADDALFQLTYTQLVDCSAHNFRFWMELSPNQRSNALGAWDNVLNRVALENPNTGRFVRLLKVLQVMQEKSRIFDQEEVDLDREAALIERASDLENGKTVFELADIYYKGNAMWTAKPEHYQALFINRLLSTLTTGVVEQQLGVSLYKALKQRAQNAKFDRHMRNKPDKYWPEPSYTQPDSPLDIDWSIRYRRKLPHLSWRIVLT